MAKNYRKVNSPIDLTYEKGNVVASFKYNHKTFRYNLVKIEKRLFLPKICAFRYDDTVYDCDKIVDELEQKLPLLKKAMVDVAATKIPNDPKSTIKKREINSALAKMSSGYSEVHGGFINDFEEWISHFRKRKYAEDILAGREPRKNHPTVKDYTSACRLLKDFQHDCFPDRPITLESIDQSFITNLIEYCWEERPEISESNGYHYLTRGNLSNKSINKRFDSIFTFIDNYYGTRYNGIEKPHLEILPRKVVRLDRGELRILENLVCTNDREEMVRDYFLFLCYTGLRFSDFVRLDRTFYNKDTNELFLKATKTSAECRIFLFDKALEIANRYDFHFNCYSNQGLNRALHELLNKYDIFPEEITMEYMQQGRKIYTKKKRDLLTCHSGRRTYISIMVECGLGIYEIMSTTGHKKIDTLKFYIDRFGESRRRKFMKINQILTE